MGTSSKNELLYINSHWWNKGVQWGWGGWRGGIHPGWNLLGAKFSLKNVFLLHQYAIKNTKAEFIFGLYNCPKDISLCIYPIPANHESLYSRSTNQKPFSITSSSEKSETKLIIFDFDQSQSIFLPVSNLIIQSNCHIFLFQPITNCVFPVSNI